MQQNPLLTWIQIIVNKAGIKQVANVSIDETKIHLKKRTKERNFKKKNEITECYQHSTFCHHPNR